MKRRLKLGDTVHCRIKLNHNKIYSAKISWIDEKGRIQLFVFLEDGFTTYIADACELDQDQRMDHSFWYPKDEYIEEKVTPPMQPIIVDEQGTKRFKSNEIVEHLLGSFPGNLNSLVRTNFPQDAWDQFYQLIGYSVCGYCELSKVSDKAKDIAYDIAFPEQSLIELACEAEEKIDIDELERYADEKRKTK